MRDSLLAVAWLCWAATAATTGVEAGPGPGHHHQHHAHHTPHHSTHQHHVAPPVTQLERAPPALAELKDGGGGDPTCLNCVSHHGAKQHHHRPRPPPPPPPSAPAAPGTQALRLEAIKTQILSKLGLSTKPNVTGLAVTRQLAQDTLERAEAAEGVEEETAPPTTRQPPDAPETDDFYGRTREIITFAEPGHMLNGQTLLEFPHPHTREGEGAVLRVKAATLWVKVQAVRPHPHHSSLHQLQLQPSSRNLTLWIFRVAPSRLRNATFLNGKEFDEQTEMSASLPVPATQALGWQRFELSGTVRGWYEAAAQQRLRLLVDCSGCSGSLVEAVLFQGSPSDRPYLVVHTESVATRRVRRRAIDCHGNNTLCCKERFYVSFRDLGWGDWIIAPSGYFANYCRGDCGGIRSPDVLTSHHGLVIEEYRKTDRLNGMQPCCAPLKFSSMSLIYFGTDSNIIKRDLPKMVVEECGCP